MKPHFSHCFLLCFVQPSNNLTNRYPTDGFTNIPLTESNFKLQKPYDIPLEQRYSFQNGVHRLWVYADDKPYDPSSPAQPRTEIRILGLDYSYGVWQFEGYGFVPNSTFGATIVQIHGATNYTTTIILRIYNWDMSFSNSKGTKSICIKGKFTNTKGNFSNKSNFNIKDNNSSRNKDNTNSNECNNNKGSIVTNI
ncbi:citrate-binding protein-like isoform X2 [Camellia sinensis]|uniref:citrate-binding protein-like isoform X2 n=1 Tax=Camellia sinensis TaxID=4442 RepID=UPI001036921C|nr:citrate-binding protein-like isoform X2 [Camellia sinensis]